VSEPYANKRRLSIRLQLFRGAVDGPLRFRKELPIDLAAEELREALIRKADEVGVRLLAQLAAYKRGEAEGALKLREVFHFLIDVSLQGQEELTVAEAVRYLDERGHFPELLLRLLDEMAAGGKVGAVPDLLWGHVGVLSIPLSDELKLPPPRS
jgi:hypothetical protein